MVKKMVAICLIACLLLSLAACSTVDGQKEYPVTIAHSVITQSPQSVITLSDSIADMLIACGYQSKIKGRSDACTQSVLESVQSVGSKSDPDASTVIQIAPDIIFADETLSAEKLSIFEDAGITVLRMVLAQTREELTSMYQKIGAVMGGNITGTTVGENAANGILTSLDDNARRIPEVSVVNTACYLFNIEGSAVTGDMFANELFQDAGAVNIASDLTGGTLDFAILTQQDPKYIFCSEGLKEQLAQNDDYKELTAYKRGKIVEIPSSLITRQGSGALEAAKLMAEAIYPSLRSGQTSADGSVADQYGITLQEGLTFTLGDGSDDPDDNEDGKRGYVLAVQQRLDDLDYWPLDEITGYFGETTEAVVREFKENNGLDGTDGTVDEQTLLVLFSDSAIQRKTPAREKDEASTQAATDAA